MYVIFKCLGQVHVDHMPDPLDVEPSARHVGGHQHLHSASAEAFQRTLSFVLQRSAGGLSRRQAGKEKQKR